MKKHKKGKAMTARHMPNGIKGGGGLCDMNPGKAVYQTKMNLNKPARGTGGS